MTWIPERQRTRVSTAIVAVARKATISGLNFILDMEFSKGRCEMRAIKRPISRALRDERQ